MTRYLVRRHTPHVPVGPGETRTGKLTRKVSDVSQPRNRRESIDVPPRLTVGRSGDVPVSYRSVRRDDYCDVEWNQYPHSRMTTTSSFVLESE